MIYFITGVAIIIGFAPLWWKIEDEIFHYKYNKKNETDY
jgi:hypothetical protein